MSRSCSLILSYISHPVSPIQIYCGLTLCQRSFRATSPLSTTQKGIHAVLEHSHNTGHYLLWNEVKIIDRDPHWYTRRVKEAIHIRLHPNNINRDSGIEIPEAWMPTIKQSNNKRTIRQRTAEGTKVQRNAPIAAVENLPIAAEHPAL